MKYDLGVIGLQLAAAQRIIEAAESWRAQRSRILGTAEEKQAWRDRADSELEESIIAYRRACR